MVKLPSFARWLIALSLLALCSPGFAAEVLRFQVYLDDKPIGEHSFRISENGELKRISSSASFDVDFLFINAYRYRHTSREVFRKGCLQEIRATTDDNGKKYRVEGDALGKQFRIEHQDGKEQADGRLMTFAYWDPSFLDEKRLLNAQTGELEGAVESYALNPDGTVATTFRFNKDGFDGPLKTYRPKGFVLDKRTNARWGMQFVWPIKADYRIIYLDADYQLTVIGRSKRDYVWVMSRKPELSDEEFARIKDFVRSVGYDITRLQRVPQRPPQKPI